MTSTNWGQILQTAKPQKGFAPLDPGQYRFRILSGQGKTAGTGSEMISVQLEVISAGPSLGRKAFHNFVLPTGQNDTDPDKIQTRIDRFLGDMEAFGLPKDWFVQLWSAQGPTKETCDYVAQTLVNRTCKATASLQKDDKSRNNFNAFIEDDGVDPAPVAAAARPAAPAPAPVMPGITPGGYPAPGGLPAGPPVPAAPAVPVAAAPAAPPAAPAVPGIPQAAPAMPGMPGVAPAAAPAFQPPAAPVAPAVPAAPVYAAPPAAPVAPPAAPAAPAMPGAPAMPSASF